MGCAKRKTKYLRSHECKIMIGGSWKLKRYSKWYRKPILFLKRVDNFNVFCSCSYKKILILTIFEWRETDGMEKLNYFSTVVRGKSCSGKKTFKKITCISNFHSILYKYIHGRHYLPKIFVF